MDLDGVSQTGLAVLAESRVPHDQNARAPFMTTVHCRSRILRRGALYASILTVACGSQEVTRPTFDGDVRVGVLHSRTGTLAVSENTVAEAELLAIREINESGGLEIDGRHLRVVALEEDGQSSPDVFAARLRRMIDRDRVSVVFGGWTSSSRKAMLPVLEARDHLLFYPVQFEGEECSNKVFYAGSTPNQQVAPAVEWLVQNHGDQFVLAGSDYVYPRTANRIIRNQLEVLGGDVAGEFYIELGSTDVASIVEGIRRSLPDGGVIINTINGDSNLYFFRELRDAGLTRSAGYVVMSFSLAEEEVSAIGAEIMEGTYTSWSFYQSMTTESARDFNTRFHSAYGAHRVTSDPAATGYSMVHLWAEAAKKAGSVDPVDVRAALPGTTVTGPLGTLVALGNHHLLKGAFLGEVQQDGQFRIVHSVESVPPDPWSQWLPENRGYSCDWSLSRDDAARFRVDRSSEGL